MHVGSHLHLVSTAVCGLERCPGWWLIMLFSWHPLNWTSNIFAPILLGAKIWGNSYLLIKSGMLSSDEGIDLTPGGGVQVSWQIWSVTVVLPLLYQSVVLKQEHSLSTGSTLLDRVWPWQSGIALESESRRDISGGLDTFKECPSARSW